MIRDHKKMLLTLILCSAMVGAWQEGNERVRLEDISAITLHTGQYTTGRRSSSVPQLKCVGGSAGCSAFQPKVVQCHNVGSDGFDVQWECKTDMDDSYRFGKIQVSCEGYDHPNDPYILRGSCGLEYTIDYTEAGKSRNSYWSSDSGSYYASKRSSGGGSWFFFILLVSGIGFMIYKMGRANRNENNPHQPPPPPDSRFRGPGNNPGFGGSSPPPYGFKPGTSSSEPGVPPPSYSDATSHNAGHSSQSQGHGSQTRTGTETNNRNGPGFWSGMGLGGLTGYLFGRRNNYGGYNRGYGHGYGGGYGSGYGAGYGSGYGSGFSSGWGSSWGGSSARHRSGGSARSSSSSTRTASGFGGTSRR